MESADQLFFATVWFGFIGVWTVQAIRGSPLFAMFSLPFWAAGVSMLSNVLLKPFTSETLEVGSQEYVITKQFWGHTIASDTYLISDLEDTPLRRCDGESCELVFQEEHPFGGSLRSVEAHWVQKELQRYLVGLGASKRFSGDLRQRVDQRHDSYNDRGFITGGAFGVGTGFTFVIR